MTTLLYSSWTIEGTAFLRNPRNRFLSTRKSRFPIDLDLWCMPKLMLACRLLRSLLTFTKSPTPQVPSPASINLPPFQFTGFPPPTMQLLVFHYNHEVFPTLAPEIALALASLPLFYLSQLGRHYCFRLPQKSLLIKPSSHPRMGHFNSFSAPLLTSSFLCLRTVPLFIGNL